MVGGSPGLRTLYISVIASFLFSFLALKRVNNKYGPLLIELVLEISKDFISLSKILLIRIQFLA